MVLTPKSLAYAGNGMLGDWAGNWLAFKRSAGVASEVILMYNKYASANVQIRLPTLTLESRGNVTRELKHG